MKETETRHRAEGPSPKPSQYSQEAIGDVTQQNKGINQECEDVEPRTQGVQRRSGEETPENSYQPAQEALSQIPGGQVLPKEILQENGKMDQLSEILDHSPHNKHW